eukprot:scaffold116478_cov75-Phaeocystis_antarctica.AAC.1
MLYTTYCTARYRHLCPTSQPSHAAPFTTMAAPWAARGRRAARLRQESAKRTSWAFPAGASHSDSARS